MKCFRGSFCRFWTNRSPGDSIYGLENSRQLRKRCKTFLSSKNLLINLRLFPGKAFSVLGVADNAIPLVSGVLYSKLYNATIHTHPEAIFYLTMGSQVAVFVLVLYVFFRVLL